MSEPEWFMAINNGNDEQVAELLTQHPDLVYKFFEDGFTALHFAAWNGHEKVVARLLTAYPALINVRSHTKFSALDVAAEYGHAGVVTQLLAANADLVVPSGQMTPLHLAALNGHEGIVALLLAAKPELACAVAYEQKVTALHMAAERGHERVFAQLLAACPQLIDAVSTNNATVLHFAACHGRDKIVEQIVALRPEMVTMANKNGQEALPMAIFAGHEHIAERLLEVKPELVNRIGLDEYTVLHLAVTSDCTTTEFVAKVLRMQPEALYCFNYFCRTPLNYAMNFGKEHLVELFQWKVSFDILHDACDRDYIDFNVRFRPVMEQQCEALFACLLEDVVGIVFEYMGFRPFKRGPSPSRALVRFQVPVLSTFYVAFFLAPFSLFSALIAATF